MARNKLLLVGIVFLPILLFASPAFSTITSDGTVPGVPVEDDWELTFIKLAGTSDGSMPDPTLDYNEATGEYTVTSAGHDIWDSQDGCAFVYMTIPTGDWSVRVQVDTDFTGPATNAWSKAGVMVRDSVTPDSKYVFYNTTRNDGGDANMQWRDADNTGAAYTALDAAAGSLGARWWLRLDRVGNDFIGYYSTDNVNWTQGANPASHANANFSDPVYVGFALTSHEATVETTMVFSNFEVPGYEPGTKAKADSPVWGYGNEAITLDGRKSTKTTTYLWTQIKETGDPTVAITNANQAVATITPPGTDIGYDLLFRLTVTGETGTDSKDVRVNVRAINAPKVAPGPFRVMPLDLGTAGLGYRVEWPELFDAEQYDIGLDLGGTIYWLETIGVTTYDVKGLTPGAVRTIVIRGRNKHGSSDAPAAIATVSRVAMRNLARPASMGGTTEPSDYVYVISHYAITGMNNIVYNDNNDSWNGLYKEEDYWGYLWATPLFFDHIAYYTGDMFGDGGWFLDLKLQYTTDGTTWLDAPIVKIEPAYDFTDQFTGKDDFARYDIEIPTLRGTGIRIAGTPGGSNTFTSIAEMEVFGLQTQGPLIVQGIDAEYPEGGTALLNGSISFSTAGPIMSYQWTGPGGITITNPTSAIASFQAPHVAADTTYVFSLQAGDGTNTGTDADVQILVKNLVTTAVAGPDQSVEEDTQATLDGSGSLTTTGNITYLWSQTGGTNVNVTGKTTATVNFTAPIIWDYEDDLTFNLTVNDGAGGASSDEVEVTVRNALAWPAYPVTYPATTSYLQNMLHLGTNSTDRLMNPHNWGNITSGLDPLEPFGGVRNIRPYPGQAYDFTGMGPTPNRNPLVWTPVFSSSGIFDNTPLDEFQMHYSVYILSPADRDVRWHVRNDDEVRVFCNGATVLSRDSWDVNIEQVEDGLLENGRGLKKGLNNITGWYEEGGGGALIAIGITDLNDVVFDDLLYSFGPSLILTDAYASRSLPTSFGPGAAFSVDLAMKVNPANKPGSVIVAETIPAGIPPANVVAPGATIGGGKITWSLAGANVKNQMLTYSLTVPSEGLTDVMDFVGTLTFGTTVADIFGENAVYPIPTAPKSLSVEMLQAAALTWAAPATAGVVEYNVYRSVNGGAYQLIAVATSTSYADCSLVVGENYSYQVSATNMVGDEGPLSRPTPQATPLTQAEVEQGREIREAEDFNYDSGQFPWTPAVTLPAIEAPNATTIGTPQEYDYYHPNTGGPDPRTYRPLDNVAAGLGIETVLDDGTTDVWHTNIGWIDVTSWWRYTFNVTQAGWVDIALRVAAPSSSTMAVYWDEVLIGRTHSFATGTWHNMIYVQLEDRVEATAGEHVVRVESAAGGMNFDKIAIAWNAAAPKRQTIWGDNFDTYTATADVFSPTNGKWTRGNTTNTAGSWTLWDTEGPDLGTEPANIAAMEDKFMISDSDLSGAGVLLNEEMLSPEVDCTQWTKLRLNFNYNYRIYDDADHTQTAEADIRSFDPTTGWSGWTNLLHLEMSDVDPTADPPELSGSQVYDLSAYDGKKIQLKFHFFDAEYDYWFAVDEIRVSGVQLAVQIPLPRITRAAGNVTVSWDAFGPGQYSVEYTANLKGTWTKIAGPFTQTSFTEAMRTDETGYYRILGQ